MKITAIIKNMVLGFVTKKNNNVSKNSKIVNCYFCPTTIDKSDRFVSKENKIVNSSL